MLLLSINNQDLNHIIQDMKKERQYLEDKFNKDNLYKNIFKYQEKKGIKN